jgi:polysaccharide export outer membrane protein
MANAVAFAWMRIGFRGICYSLRRILLTTLAPPPGSRHLFTRQKTVVRITLPSRPLWALLFAGSMVLGPWSARAQSLPKPAYPLPDSSPATTEDFNRRLEQLRRSVSTQMNGAVSAEYRIGSQDLLEVNVFDAPELNRSLRVSANGEISLPLVGAIQASGLTAREVENSLESRLRTYMNDPHVGVLVTGVESHPVSVLGAVNQPGVFQVRGPKTLLEMLSMAQGLTDEAGDKVLVMRGAGVDSAASDVTKDVVKDPSNDASNNTPNNDLPASSAPMASMAAASTANSPGKTESATTDPNTIQIDLRQLLDSADPRFNVPIYPGDIVKVKKAGIVYVVGSVMKPGGFTMRTNEQMSVLKAVALAEGLTSTSSKGHTRIIRTDPITGERSEIPVDLGKVLAGKTPDMPLRAADIVFVPKSGTKAALYRGSEAAIATASGVIIFHP